MKLNREGQSKILDAEYGMQEEITAVKLEQGDVRDAVVLSFEEAKEILDNLKFATSFVRFPPKELKDSIDRFEKQIEFAESVV